MKAKLIVEIDGLSHDMGVMNDENRTQHLNKAGYKVIRFTNDDVKQNLEAVVETILNMAKKLLKNKIDNKM